MPRKLNHSQRSIIAQAADLTGSQVKNRDFDKQSKGVFEMFADDMQPLLHDGETGTLFLPCSVSVDGKDLLGAALTLSNRTVLAWAVGGFRIHTTTAIIEHAKVTNVRVYKRKSGRFSPLLDTLKIRETREWEVVMVPGANAWLSSALRTALTTRQRPMYGPRHTLASDQRPATSGDLRRAGAPLATATYAKVDHAPLRPITPEISTGSYRRLSGIAEIDQPGVCDQQPVDQVPLVATERHLNLQR